VAFFLLVIVGAQCEEHLYSHGPFRKAHLSGERTRSSVRNQMSGIFHRSIRSASVSISELKVSSRNYSNGETIYVSWIPSPAACADDFIGIYFVETPEESGKT